MYHTTEQALSMSLFSEKLAIKLTSKLSRFGKSFKVLNQIGKAENMLT